MSKTAVGDVYDKVIKEVCDQSRVDFEEGGVELTTLELLKSEWQKKLSQLKVTQLPWDPPPTHARESTNQSNSKSHPQTLPSNGNPIKPPPPAQNVPPMPTIKQEPNMFPSQAPVPQNYSTPAFPQGPDMSARDRAAMNLHQSFGSLAGAQIAQLQQPGRARAPGLQAESPAVGQVKEEDEKPSLATLDDYQANVSQVETPAIKTSQNDGAGDDPEVWRSEYLRRKNLVSRHRQQGDRLMRDHFNSVQQQLEGGGLLLPLDERTLGKVHKKQRTSHPDQGEQGSGGTTAKKTDDATPSSLSLYQGDASGDLDDDDDDDEDEDAINSDLDDPDELAANDDNEENTDQVMLCTYDKVQRVKNKWKCTLKDGVLRVEGTEYVFHKGQGEFEW